MGVLEASSEMVFDQATAGLARSCVFFWAAWHEPSKPGGQMDQVFTQLAEVHRGLITFIKVEAEAVPEVSEKVAIAMVPTFVLLKGGVVCDKVEGADPPALAKRVQEFANESVPEKEAGEAGGDGVGPELRSKLNSLIVASPVMLFMKGNSSGPKCKFSRKMVEILRGAGVDFGSFDILTDEDVRAGLKIFSKHPTFPQLYVKGALVGGVDDVEKLSEKGDLKAQLGMHVRATTAPAAVSGMDVTKSKSVTNRCKDLIARAEVMLFMKGSPDEPRCGFSRTIVSMLREDGVDFSHFDILQDQDVRQTLKELSNWPTYPQLYVNGELIGGLDILKEMRAEGPLAQQLGITPKESLETRLKRLVSSHKIMLFMKGTPDAPKCGFSRTAVGILREENVDFGTFDILEDDEIRQGLKTFSNWPTYPQLYAGGELLGGLDIMKEMQAADELSAALRQ